MRTAVDLLGYSDENAFALTNATMEKDGNRNTGEEKEGLGETLQREWTDLNFEDRLRNGNKEGWLARMLAIPFPLEPTNPGGYADGYLLRSHQKALGDSRCVLTQWLKCRRAPLGEDVTVGACNEADLVAGHRIRELCNFRPMPFQISDWKGAAVRPRSRLRVQINEISPTPVSPGVPACLSAQSERVLDQLPGVQAGIGRSALSNSITHAFKSSHFVAPDRTPICLRQGRRRLRTKRLVAL